MQSKRYAPLCRRERQACRRLPDHGKVRRGVARILPAAERVDPVELQQALDDVGVAAESRVRQHRIADAAAHDALAIFCEQQVDGAQEPAPRGLAQRAVVAPRLRRRNERVLEEGGSDALGLVCYRQARGDLEGRLQLKEQKAGRRRRGRTARKKGATALRVLDEQLHDARVPAFRGAQERLRGHRRRRHVHVREQRVHPRQGRVLLLQAAHGAEVVPRTPLVRQDALQLVVLEARLLAHAEGAHDVRPQPRLR